MSIKSRIQDAELLWHGGRSEGAWIMALIAAAATSRKRYPKPMPDNKAFKSFIRDVLPTIILGHSMEPNSPNPRMFFGDTPVEDIIYHQMRCNLLHEATLSEEVAFSKSRIVDGKVLCDLVVGSPNILPESWVFNLIKAVREARENVSEFSETA